MTVVVSIAIVAFAAALLLSPIPTSPRRAFCVTLLSLVGAVAWSIWLVHSFHTVLS